MKTSPWPSRMYQCCNNPIVLHHKKKIVCFDIDGDDILESKVTYYLKDSDCYWHWFCENCKQDGNFWMELEYHRETGEENDKN